MDTLKVPEGIIRFEHGATRGWWVRIMRENTMFRKLFSDSVYGSSTIALEKAIEHVNEIKKAFPRSRRRYANIKRRNSSGPIPGVRRALSTRKGHEYASWVAAWSPEPGVYKTKRFGVLKYGETGAMRLAIQLRIDELKKIKDTFPVEYESQIKEIPIELINSGVLSYAPSTKSSGELPPNIKNDELELEFESDPFAFEGASNFSLHLEIERSKNLRDKKIKEYLRKHGHISCELCLTNLKQIYPFLTKDFIEIHHIIPLSQLTSPKCNSLEDLMLLCPNCHTAVHQGDAQDNLLEAMLLFGRDFT